MELRRYLRLLLRRWLLIVVTVVVALAVALAVTPSPVTSYTSQATVLVGPRIYASGPVTNLPSSDQAAGLNYLVGTYAHLVDTAAVAQGALAATGAPRSLGQVLAETSASSVQLTQLITISVTDRSPAVAEELANGVAQSFVAKVSGPNGQAAVGAPAITLESFGAAAPSASVTSGRKRNLALAGVLGLLVAVILAVLVEYLDVTVKDGEEAERRLGAPVLATVGTFADPDICFARQTDPAGAEIG